MTFGESIGSESLDGRRKPAPSPTSDMTKYLCAAAYLDPQFASTVVSQVLEERHRFVAPSYGVDVPTVVRHCLVARRRELVLQLALASVLFLAVVRLMRALSTGAEFGLLSFLFPYFVAWGIVFGETLYRRHVLVARRIGTGDLDVDHLGITDGPTEERLKELAADQREGNITVYSGFSPFVGSGVPAEGWSFVLDLTRCATQGDAEERPLPVDIVELHDFVATGLQKLGLTGLRVENRLFVNGQELRDDRRFLPDPLSRPVTRVDPETVRSFIGQQTHAVREYLSARVVDWRGELVVSVFLRFLSVSDNLFAEANYYVLPGLKRGYHAVDALTAEPTVRQVVRLLAETGRQTPRKSLKAPAAVAGWVLSPLQRQSSDRATERAIRENPVFDYGARASIRELAMSSGFRRYFQRIDKEMYVKVLEHRILDLVVQFLDDHNVDTAELRERRSVIVNNGVMLSGGTLNADSVAAGDNARATGRRNAKRQEATATEGAGA